MKKILPIIIAISLSLGLVACNNVAKSPQKNNPTVDNLTIVSTDSVDIPDDLSALETLQLNNETYLTAVKNDADISTELRESTVTNAQLPYAVVLTCSDSRVIPEHIFMEGIGEIFTVRNAGNIVDDTVLGSIEYGAEHLHAEIIVVLGHSYCGAVDATIKNAGHDRIKTITDKIYVAIKDTQDPREAEIINVQNSINEIMKSSLIKNLVDEEKIKVVGGIYNDETGKVDFMEDFSYTSSDNNDELYSKSVSDAMIAEDDEIFELVTISNDDPNTTWNEDGKVLLTSWNKYPDSYPTGETMTISYGDVWAVTDKELASWYKGNL